MIHETMVNQSNVVEFVLLGFPGVTGKFQIAVSLSFFVIYNIALFSNGIALILIIHQAHLHQPMYIIVANLALSDLIFDTLTLPKIIAKYWFGDGSLSFLTCFFQMFFVHNLGSLDSLTIMMMAIDRFVAICRPLHYSSIITNKVVMVICFIFWLIASLIGLAIAIMGALLPYCGPNKIKNCFCAFSSVVGLSCVDPLPTRHIAFTIGLITHLLPLSFIIFSYIFIIKKIRKMAHVENWHKVFYTCTTHWIVIFLYFVPRLSVYTYNQFQVTFDADVTVLLICIYTFVPHFTSPIIYCLRTKEIKENVKKILKKTISVNGKMRDCNILT
ncbi:olfactory receptor 56A5-like [Dendropsophus ebraccatus]|uniref:olfactory receptor 56A5-like n=1 Tax=Dendropsophus ebraccatus TaxID=150705 RepID=UPI0038321901